MQSTNPTILSPIETVRILLIEDDQSYRHLCEKYMAKDTQRLYDVVEATSGVDGIAACRSQNFDCVLIDYSLPDQTGTQVIAELVCSLGSSAPPCIILTAEGGEQAAADALRAGAADFLPKRYVSTKPLSRSIGNAIEKGRLRQSIEDHTQALEIANDALNSKNHEIQNFYQNVSHEVKTPLAAAREFIAIVKDGIAGPVTDQQQEMLLHAVESCDQIAGHFNDLIEMTRLDARKIRLNRQLASLHQVATRCFASTKAAARAKNISLESEFIGTLPLMVFDRNRIVQVLSNLLGNAIKFTAKNGTVRLSMRYDIKEKSVDTAIMDTGCGIDEEHLPHIFDRLYQVQNAHDKFTGAGLGLGLSIAKEIVVLHGGTIKVNSIVGEGTTFTVRLPDNSCKNLETI